ncbi:cell division protein FtsA [Sulfurimonas gotlandica GD1]|uniref:Cell division protein FtsA n=1 Tax=Sulfurimonas gotlandica (strain DSM 19862 / JCM 16533 / GD1) TaxID=929558 RepID=B6BML2_SULGG|nr:cell division protein FtsA [Sulfurimonas gotlandica]EDZ61497.1 cell division protein FtsA [Sulfurimonas gotlandica GD1]EHP30872.1 cell division protein FtsA [Sulfurimonas gotlandica GD1]
MSRTVLAIDIGSTKICAIIAEISDDGSIAITGAGTSKAQGLKKGSITNIELASKSIKTALNDAKRVSGSDVRTAVVSISGAYTKSLNSNGIVNIQNKEISFKEIERVMHTSLYNANIPNEYDVLHALPFNFKVDDQDFIEDPLGMNASRLEVETHIITTQKSNLNNLKKAVRGAGVEVENIVLNGYASSIATLNQDEKELGVAVIDMGGNTSNITIHSGNSIRYNDFLGVGSNHVTSDLSMALHTPLNIADSVKLSYGSLLTPSNELIELPIIGDENTTHEVSLEVVHNVIFARVEETLMILAQFIENSGLKDQLGAGIVLTGGFSKMEGIRDLAIATFGSVPVRLARPIEMDGLFDNLRSAEFSSAIGLVMYSASAYTPYEIDVNKRVRHSKETPVAQSSVDFSSEPEIPIAPSSEEEQVQKMVTLPSKKEKKSDEAGAFSKFWNWATQLF